MTHDLINMSSIQRITIEHANALYRAGQYRQALRLYDILSNDPWHEKILTANIQICRKHLGIQAEPTTTEMVSADSSAPASKTVAPSLDILHPPPKIIVTLTTIHSRLPLLHKVIESLNHQQLLPAKILLNISCEPYLLDAGIQPDNSVLQELQKLPLLEINWVPNTGPYRKIQWFLEQHFSHSITKDKLFVTVDDDTKYPDYFLQKLYDTYVQHDCIVAFRGRYLSLQNDCIVPYKLWALGQDKPALCNLPTGKDGVLYNTKFFTREFLELSVALKLAPTADDLWIKWHCALNGIPSIILNPEACTSDYKSFPVVNYDRSYRNISLYAQHNSSEAHNKNDISVQYLENYFLDRYGYNLMTLIRSAEFSQL